MSQKNETTVLFLAILVTLGLVGILLWWFTERLKIVPPTPNNSNPVVRTDTPTSINQLGQPNIDSFAKVPDVPSGLFNYGGSTTWAPIRRDVDPIVQNAWPQFKLRYTDHPTRTPGSGTGIQMLLDDQLAFSQSSRQLNDQEYQKAEQRGFKLKQIPVAIDGLAIAVNPDLNIPGLTVSQISDIYTGKITNWNQLGGPDMKITPYTRRIEDGGTVEFFIDNVLQKQDFVNVEFVFSTTDALRKLAENQGGIYYASAPEIVNQCTVKTLPIGRTAGELIPPYKEPFVPLSQCPEQRNQLNANAFQSGQYPITRRLFAIVKQNGQIDERAGEAYAKLLLTDRGQELIEKAGFVRIR